MFKIRWILLPVLLLGPCVLPAHGQTPTPGGPNYQDATSPYRQNVRRAGQLTQAPHLISKPYGNRHRLSTYDTARYAGIVTMPEQARSLLPRYRLPSRFDMSPLPMTPTEYRLQRENLLGVRSPLARKITSTNGRNDFVLDPETGQMSGDYARIAERADAAQPGYNPNKADNGSYQDAIVKRLQAKADDYYALGTAAFRQGKYINASNYFDLVKDVEFDKTRPYLAKTIVDVQKSDYITAHSQLLRAMDIAHDLDSLKLDLTQFYKNPEDFRRRTEQLNLQLQRFSESPVAALILSYYLWVNGDIETAISTAATAEKNSPGASAVPIKKFRDFLVLQRSGQKPGAAGAGVSGKIVAPSPGPSTSQKAL